MRTNALDARSNLEYFSNCMFFLLFHEGVLNIYKRQYIALQSNTSYTAVTLYLSIDIVSGIKLHYSNIVAQSTVATLKKTYIIIM